MAFACDEGDRPTRSRVVVLHRSCNAHLMVIIWRRWGPLGLLFLVAGFLLWVVIAAISRSAMHITATTGWWSVVSLIVGFGIGAAANYFVAVRVVEPRLDKRNTEAAKPPSTLFFLPLRRWTWVIVAIGLVFLVPNALAAAAG